MNEVFNLGINFYQLLLLIILAILGTIAIRITFSFDLNRYMEDKRKRNLSKLKNACTHHQIIQGKDQYAVQPLFISPPGTLQWQCQRCGAIKYFADGELERMSEYYANNPEEYIKQEKRFKKLVKKSKLI